MSKIFNMVKGNRPKRTAFDLSHEVKTTFNIGELIPIMNDEVVPGDKWKVNSEVMIRMAPMLAPIMHRVNAYVHYFYVPKRVIWDEFPKFISGESEVTVPCLKDGGTIAKSSIAEYLGLPKGETLGREDLSQLPVRAYMSIWNEYYRDQNLQNEVDFTDQIEVSQAALGKPYKRAWEKDYFTSALPWAQKGDATTLPVSNQWTYKQEAQALPPSVLGPTSVNLDATDYLTAAGTRFGIDNLSAIDGTIDLNEFRTANRIQRWLEKQARGGSRYAETLLHHFGMKIPDLLYRPQYIGGGKIPVRISEVLNTAGSDATDSLPVGEMSGHGIAVGNSAYTEHTFNEHGYIFGILSVIPKTTYSQGIHKSWLRKTKFDFYWPEFAHLGEQEIKKRELYYNSIDPDGVFGYQSAWAEYKYKNSRIHGDFTDNLEFWHMGRQFATEPALNSDFITCDNNEVSRVFAVKTGQETWNTIWCNVYNKVTAVRPLPLFGTPSL